MIIRSEHVKPLELFNDQAFADWLTRGYKDLLNEERRLFAFEPLNYFVRRGGNLTDELKDIYELLSGNAQEKFRHGIALALENLPPRISSIAILRNLLHLSGRVHAPEVLPIIIQQIGNGYFGIPENNAGRELFALALDIAAGMAPAHEVGNAIRRLVASSYFRSGYAPRAFIALCRCEPEKFPDHLKLLRNNFTQLHSEAGTGEAYLTARRFAQYVDTWMIAKKLWLVYFTADPGIKALNTDNWLGKSLFLGDNAPFMLDKKDDVFFITRRDQSEQGQQLKINLSASKNWSKAFNVKKFLDRCLDRSMPVKLQKVLLPLHQNVNWPSSHSTLSTQLDALAQNSPLWAPLKQQVSTTTRGLRP